MSEHYSKQTVSVSPKRFVLLPTPYGWDVYDREQRMVIDSGYDDEAQELIDFTRSMNSLALKFAEVM